jgi:hypothetical protein
VMMMMMMMIIIINISRVEIVFFNNSTINIPFQSSEKSTVTSEQNSV